jgi:hypothetical protein
MILHQQAKDWHEEKEYQLKEVVKNSSRKIAALEAENEQLRKTVAFHENYIISKREERAYSIIVAMIQSKNPSYRLDLDVKEGVKKAYEIADALTSGVET